MRLANNSIISPEQLGPLAVMGLFMFAAVVSGVVVGSGNLVFIALTVGPIVGVVLLSAVPSVVGSSWSVRCSSPARCFCFIRS